MRLSWTLLAFAGAHLATGCSSDADGDTNDHANEPDGGLELTDSSQRDDSARADTACIELDACDIRREGCQQHIADWVACTRGGDTPMPPVRVVDEAEAVEALSDLPTLLPELTAERLEALLAEQAEWSRVLASVGMLDLEEASDEYAVERFAAFYRNDTDEVLVIDRGMPLDDSDAVNTLAHELTHAMQHAELDLPTFHLESYDYIDSSLALTAVIEGEATHYGSLAAVVVEGEDPHDFDWEGRYAEWQTYAYEEADAETSPLPTASLQFPYAFGGAWMTRMIFDGGRDAVETIYRTPPGATHEILFGGRQERERALQAVLDTAVPLSDVLQAFTYNVLGAWLVRAFLRRAGLDDDRALETTEAVAADALLGLRAPSLFDGTVAVWRMRLFEDTQPAVAQRFLELELPDSRIWVDDLDVYVVVGPPEVLDFAEQFRWGSVFGAPAASDEGSEANPVPRARGWHARTLCGRRAAALVSQHARARVR